MASKITYDLAVDARWISQSNRGIGTYILNLIIDNKKLSFYKVILFIEKSSEDIVKNLNTDYKIVSDYFLISDMNISIFIKNNNVKSFFAPGNILPIFPLFCLHKILVLHDVSFFYPVDKIGKRSIRQSIGACLRRIIVPFSLIRSDQIITVSHFAKEEIEKYYFKYLKNKIDVIYHGFELEKIKNTYKIPIKFIAVLGESEQKNIKIFLEACDLCFNNFFFHVCLVGVSKEYLRKKNICYNKPWLTIEGKVSNKLVKKKIRDSSCLIMPSYYESFGMPVLEALINKISVICSNTGALPEITKELALYFNPYNAKDISSKMEFFIENYSEIIKKTERWHENYARMFTLKLFHYNYNKMFFKDKIK